MTTTIPEETGTAAAPKKARVAPRRAHVAPAKAKAGKKASAGKKAPKGGSARDGSKTAKILDLLKRSGGAELKELMKATGWQAHSIRGFLSGTVGKKMGLTVASTKGRTGSAAAASRSSPVPFQRRVRSRPRRRFSVNAECQGL